MKMCGKLYALVLAVVVFVSVSGNAAPVDRGRARAIAMTVLSSDAQALEIRMLSDAPEQGNPPYYVFTEKGGRFVIVAGDDRAFPILGYGEKWDNESIPDALTEMLTGYSEQIKHVTDDAPTMTLPASEIVEKVLATAKWGQDAPYNNLTPGDYPAGCVATAMATVMKYHNHPDCGKGFNSYEWGGQMLSCDFSKTTFDWNNMRMSYNSSDGYSDSEANAVAQLMQACGVAVEMYYDSGGSASTILDASNALVNYFRYDGKCQYVSSNDFTDEGWKKLIRQEIDAGRPVIYSGKSSSGAGHAFVCDGYDSNGLFHFNWGWNGACDGFYALDAMKPLFTDYSLNAAMVTNISPAEADVTYSQLVPAVTGMGLSIDTENVESGVAFNAFVGGIATVGDTGEWNGQLALALTDSAGAIKEIARSIDVRFTSLMEVSTEFTGCVFSGAEINDGDMVSLVARSGTVGKWLPLRGTTVRPASCRARGNEVRRATVTWDVYPATMEIVLDPQCGNSTLLYPLLSSPLSWTVSLPDNAATVYYAIDGKELTGSDGVYSIASVNHDYTVTIRAYTAEELIDGLAVNLPVAGTLQETISVSDAERICRLAVSGTVDARDFDFMRERMISLREVDLSGARIVSRLANHALYIPYNAFDGCRRLEAVTLPVTLVGIHDYAFRRTSIAAIDLPSGVRTIGDGAFYSAASLSSVIARNPDPVTINSRVFFGTKRSTGTLYVPVGSYSGYKSATFWNLFGQIIEDPSLSGIYSVVGSNLRPAVSRTGNSLIVTGVAPGTVVEVYSLGGIMLHRSVLMHNSEIVLADSGYFAVRLNGMMSGIY